MQIHSEWNIVPAGQIRSGEHTSAAHISNPGRTDDKLQYFSARDVVLSKQTLEAGGSEPGHFVRGSY
jgi:hypothetical protein